MDIDEYINENLELIIDNKDECFINYSKLNSIEKNTEKNTEKNIEKNTEKDIEKNIEKKYEDNANEDEEDDEFNDCIQDYYLKQEQKILTTQNKFTEEENQKWLRVYKGILLAKKDKKWDDKSKDVKAKKSILLSYGVNINDLEWFIKQTS